jgi:hypothetical protein
VAWVYGTLIYIQLNWFQKSCLSIISFTVGFRTVCIRHSTDYYLGL